MARMKLVNGELIPLSAAEETARDAEEAAAPGQAMAEMDIRAAREADAVIGKALLRLLWDQEARLRALGSQSAIGPVRNAADQPAYRAAVVAHIRGMM